MHYRKPKKQNGKPDPAILATIIREIIEAAKPEKIVLFGSAARGEMGPDSDYDLLVIKRGKFDYWWWLGRIRRRLSGAAPVDVVLASTADVERYRDEHCLVICPALKEGKVVYESERFAPNDPREWLNRARSDLACSQAPIADAYLEDLCFHAQQCAEKAVKAVFIHRGQTFPYVHDLKKLLDLLKANGLNVPKYVAAADELTDYAAVMRYPDFYSAVNARKHRRAVRLAAAVLRWAERQILPPAKKSKS